MQNIKKIILYGFSALVLLIIIDFVINHFLIKSNNAGNLKTHPDTLYLKEESRRKFLGEYNGGVFEVIKIYGVAKDSCDFQGKIFGSKNNVFYYGYSIKRAKNWEIIKIVFKKGVN